MGSLWCDITALVSQNYNLSALVSSRSDAGAAERDEFDYQNGKVKSWTRNVLCLTFAASILSAKVGKNVLELLQQSVSKQFHTLVNTPNGANNECHFWSSLRTYLDSGSVFLKNISTLGAGSVVIKLLVTEWRRYWRLTC